MRSNLHKFPMAHTYYWSDSAYALDIMRKLSVTNFIMLEMMLLVMQKLAKNAEILVYLGSFAWKGLWQETNISCMVWIKRQSQYYHRHALCALYEALHITHRFSLITIDIKMEYKLGIKFMILMANRHVPVIITSFEYPMNHVLPAFAYNNTRHRMLVY